MDTAFSKGSRAWNSLPCKDPCNLMSWCEPAALGGYLGQMRECVLHICYEHGLAEVSSDEELVGGGIQTVVQFQALLCY